MMTATDTTRYEAIKNRDPRADGVWVYGVATTGVYCRPTCAARLALRENVSFFATPDLAEGSGYRACKRCHPRDASQTERHVATIQAVRRAIDEADAPVPLATLAKQAGLSPYYLHRLFKKIVGLTPQEYGAAKRLTRASERLQDGASVTSALYEAGYSSSSRFYEAGGGGALGMAPSDVRRGALGVAMRAAVGRCSLGHVLVAATARGVCAVTFGDSEAALLTELGARFPRARVEEADDATLALLARVIALVDATSRGADDLPLDLMGTAFQQKVWRELRTIPRGETVSYGTLAKRIGSPLAVRAVGTACGRNPVAVVVPCHRVVREDGALGGYRWGLPRKEKLLAQERKR